MISGSSPDPADGRASAGAPDRALPRGLALRLLGGFAVELAGRPLPLPSDKACALLAYLAVEARPAARGTLTALLWPDVAPASALASLRVALSALRRIAPGRLDTDAEWVAFRALADDFVDIALLRQAVAGDDAGSWRRAAEAYGGPLLAGRTSVDTPAFAEWLRPAAQEVADQARTLFLLLAGATAGDGPEEAIHFLRRAVAIDPLDEPSQRRLILALARSGEHGAALTQFATLREALAGNLGVDPETETLALRERIVTARGRRAAQPRRLPLPPTPFVGRARELAALGRWLVGGESGVAQGADAVGAYPPADPAHPCAGRLLTIAGPGGIGKTRLAIELARRLEGRFLDGVCFISLAGLDPGSPIEPGITAALGLEPVAGMTLRKQLVQVLQERELLLVLDNFEHVVAQADCCSDLLAGAPDLRILVTSREGLALPFERVVTVDGLSYPRRPSEQGAADGFGAVALFVAAAQRIAPDFDPGPELDDIGEICRLVEGMPLALELTAPWIDAANCAMIVARLRTDLTDLSRPLGLPARHAGLDAVLAHSWALLAGAERIAFAKLCVFRGGFDLTAARSVVGVTEEQLALLGRKSLLRSLGDGRYDIHEFLRVAGLRRLKASELLAGEVADAHARYFLAGFAALSRRDGAESRRVVSFVEADRDNLAAAWRHAVGRRDHAMLTEVAVDLVGFYLAQGPYSLGAACCDDVITVLSVEVDGARAELRRATTPLLARMLAERAAFELRGGRTSVAEASVREALDALAILGKDAAAWSVAARAAAAVALRQRGMLHRTAGRYDDAVVDLDAACAHAAAAGDPLLLADAAYHRAGVEAYRGQAQACIDGTAAVLASIEGRGYDRLACAMTYTLSVLHDRLGQQDAAAAAAERLYDLAHGTGYRVGEVNAQAALGMIRQSAGAFANAVDHFERAIQIAVDTGHHMAERNARLGLATTLLDIGRPADALHHIERSRAQAEAEGYPRTVAFATMLRASAERRAQHLAAAELSARQALAAFEALHDRSGSTMARAELRLTLARSGEACVAAAELDRSAAELAESGEATLALAVCLHRIRLGLHPALADARLEGAMALRDAAAAAGLRELLPATDLVIGRILLPSDPRAAAAAFESAIEGLTALGQEHLVPEAVAGLLRCPAGLEAGSAALLAARDWTDTLLRHRLFGIEDPGETVAAFRAALTILGDARVAALDGLLTPGGTSPVGWAAAGRRGIG